MGPNWSKLTEVFIKQNIRKKTCILLTYFLSCSPNLANLGHATQPTVLDLDTAKDETEANQSQALAEARRARRRYILCLLSRGHIMYLQYKFIKSISFSQATLPFLTNIIFIPPSQVTRGSSEISQSF